MRSAHSRYAAVIEGYAEFHQSPATVPGFCQDLHDLIHKGGRVLIIKGPSHVSLGDEELHAEANVCIAQGEYRRKRLSLYRSNELVAIADFGAKHVTLDLHGVRNTVGCSTEPPAKLRINYQDRSVPLEFRFDEGAQLYLLSR